MNVILHQFTECLKSEKNQQVDYNVFDCVSFVKGRLVQRIHRDLLLDDFYAEMQRCLEDILYLHEEVTRIEDSFLLSRSELFEKHGLLVGCGM